MLQEQGRVLSANPAGDLAMDDLKKSMSGIVPYADAGTGTGGSGTGRSVFMANVRPQLLQNGAYLKPVREGRFRAEGRCLRAVAGDPVVGAKAGS